MGLPIIYKLSPMILSPQFSFSRILFKNRITSLSCTFYYAICLFISHFHFFRAFHRDIYHVICIITIFFLLPLLLEVNEEQYGK